MSVLGKVEKQQAVSREDDGGKGSEEGKKAKGTRRVLSANDGHFAL
jgi:hypothetical protein